MMGPARPHWGHDSQSENQAILTQHEALDLAIYKTLLQYNAELQDLQLGYDQCGRLEIFILALRHGIDQINVLFSELLPPTIWSSRIALMQKYYAAEVHVNSLEKELADFKENAYKLSQEIQEQRRILIGELCRLLNTTVAEALLYASGWRTSTIQAIARNMERIAS